LTLSSGQEALLALAGLGAGLVNGAAGGGTLVSFPALLAVGYPALTANVTSTVGIWPGYLGGVAGFRREVINQADRVRSLVGTVVAGGVIGGILLLTTPSNDFRLLAPFLLLFACLLFAFQPLLASWLGQGQYSSRSHVLFLHGGCFVAAIYGAYFGAGLGVVLLAVLALATPEPLKRVNGLRSVLALIINTVAVVIFVVHAHIAWPAAGLMDGCALVGGYVGARVARRIPTVVLRGLIVALGLATALRLLVN
jgi:uncharacterized protein